MPHTNVFCKLVLLSTILVSTSFPAYAIVKEDPSDLLTQQQKSAPLLSHTHDDLVSYAKQLGETHVYELRMVKPTGSFNCNAVRVSKNIVLTALHCVEGARETKVNGKNVGGYIAHPRSLFSNQYPDLAALWLPEEGAHPAGLLEAIDKGGYFASFSVKGGEPIAFYVSIQDIQDDGMIYSYYKDSILSGENKGPAGILVAGNSGSGLFVYDEEKWKPIGISSVSYNHKQGWARIVPQEVEVMGAMLQCKMKGESCNQDEIFKVLTEQHGQWLTHILDDIGILDYKFSALKSYCKYLEKSQNSVLLKNFNDMMIRRTLATKADDIKKLDNSAAFRDFYSHSPLGVAMYDISMVRSIKSHEFDMHSLSFFMNMHKEHLGRYNLFHDLIEKIIIDYVIKGPSQDTDVVYAMHSFLDMVKWNEVRYRSSAYKFMEIIKKAGLRRPGGYRVNAPLLINKIGDVIYNVKDIRDMYYDLVDNISYDNWFWKESDLLEVTKTAEWEPKVELMLQTFVRLAKKQNRQGVIAMVKRFMGWEESERLQPPVGQEDQAHFRAITPIKDAIISIDSFENPIPLRARFSTKIKNELIHLFSLPKGKKKIEDIAQYPFFTDYVFEMMPSVGSSETAMGDGVKITSENYESQVLDMAARYEASLLSQIVKILKEGKQSREDKERAAFEALSLMASSETKAEELADVQAASQEAGSSHSGEQSASENREGDL